MPPESVDRALFSEPDIEAVLITSPTYEGLCSGIAAISGICHAHGVPLIVDAAHGPIWHTQERTRPFRPPLF